MSLLNNIMKIILDCRENDLIELCTKNLENSNYKNIIVTDV